MNDVTNTHGEATKISQFLTKRGAIVVKGTNQIGMINGENGDYIFIGTIVIGVAKGANRSSNYGISISRSDSSGALDATAHMDLEEIDELVEAIDFIAESARSIPGQPRDYTEVSYVSKDNIRIGFYSRKTDQQVFLQLPGGRGITFISQSRLPELRKHVLDAKHKLRMEGASVPQERA